MNHSPQNILAAIDIGTHSVRLVVVEIHPDGSWTTLDQSKEYVRLGEGEFVGGKHRITDEAIDRTALVCARFGDIAKRLGAVEVVALATAAAREAGNQEDLVERIEKESNGMVRVRVISGHEEARLIYLGVRSGIELPEDNSLFMDIGGGSTELTIADRHTYSFLDSLKMGAIRLTGEIMPSRTRPVPLDIWNRLQITVRSIAEPAARQIRRLGFTRMYGSSGTIMSLAEIASKRKTEGGAPVTLRNYELHLSEVQSIAQMLCRLPLEQRRKVPGLGAERADIIIAGAAIVQTVMETVGAESIFISDRGLREGIVVDTLLRDGADFGITAEAERDLQRDSSVRDRSTKRLARRCQIDEEHAKTVIKLANQLFDQAKLIGLHDLGDDERELLAYGALLHDCGFFISHTGHHVHSYYLIRHSELLGFNDVEVEVIAQIALYHRKSLPKDKNPAFAALPPHEQKVVRVLSCLVRVAEALDRSHLALVTNVKLERSSCDDPVTMRLTIAPGGDPSLELWAAEAQAEPFKKTFGATLNVEPKAPKQ